MKRWLSALAGACVLLAATDAAGAVLGNYQTRSNWQNGNMGFWDEVHNANYPTSSLWVTCPILAIEQDPYAGVIWYDECHEFDAATYWTLTVQGVSSYDIADGRGGYLEVTNAALEDDGTEMQYHKATESGEAWQFSAGKPLWFEVKAAFSHATEIDFAIGLADTDTTILDGSQDLAIFRKHDGDANIDFISDKDGTPTMTDTGVDVTADVFIRYGIQWDGVSTLTFFLDGVAVGTDATNVCDDETLAITLCCENGDGNARVMTIDYIKVVQVR